MCRDGRPNFRHSVRGLDDVGVTARGVRREEGEKRKRGRISARGEKNVAMV